MVRGKKKFAGSDLLRKLRDVLEKQKKRFLKSDFRGVEQLSQQAGEIIEEIKRRKDLVDAEERDEILGLYRWLILMASAHKEDVGEQMQQIGDGKKVLEVYGDNV